MDHPPNPTGISISFAPGSLIGQVEISFPDGESVFIQIVLPPGGVRFRNANAAAHPTPIPETMIVECEPRPGDECSICLHELLEGVVSLRRCGHHFHAGCIRQWGRATCPNCRESYAL